MAFLLLLWRKQLARHSTIQAEEDSNFHGMVNTTRKRTIGPAQKYQLPYHPVLILASVPAATAAGTFGRRPNMWRAIGTGWWFQPVPMRHHRNRFDPPPGTK